MTFDEWWESQVSGLGDSHKFTAWNAWLAATQFEREACAKVCEAQVEPVGNEWRWQRPEEAAKFDAQNRARLGCAAAIRMRSNK